MAYSNADKIAAAKELEAARQQVRVLGQNATRTDIKRVEKAEKRYNKVMGG